MDDIYTLQAEVYGAAISLFPNFSRPMALPDFQVNSAGDGNQLQRYVVVDLPGCQAVALEWAASAVGDALSSGTLHEWASRQPLRDEMRGRGVVYAVDLPADPVTPVVVRRNRHGGLLGRLTGEYFRLPTRAPLELATAVRLAAAGIPTPEVIAYSVYPVAGMFARSDVMTRRLPEGADVPAVWKQRTGIEREPVLVAMARLLHALASAGVRHEDLNLKNIYLAGSGADLTAYLLDVDRVIFSDAGDVADRNFARLARSVRKWRSRWGLDFDEVSLRRLAVLAKENI